MKAYNLISLVAIGIVAFLSFGNPGGEGSWALWVVPVFAYCPFLFAPVDDGRLALARFATAIVNLWALVAMAWFPDEIRPVEAAIATLAALAFAAPAMYAPGDERASNRESRRTPLRLLLLVLPAAAALISSYRPGRALLGSALLFTLLPALAQAVEKRDSDDATYALFLAVAGGFLLAGEYALRAAGALAAYAAVARSTALAAGACAVPLAWGLAVSLGSRIIAGAGGRLTDDCAPRYSSLLPWATAATFAEFRLRHGPEIAAWNGALSGTLDPALALAILLACFVIGGLAAFLVPLGDLSD